MAVEVLQAAWVDFCKTLPAGEPWSVRRERRRSFFAGALALFQVIDAIGARGSEAEGIAVLNLIQRELEINGKNAGTPKEDERVF